MADVNEVLALVDAEHERAEVLTAAARLGEPADHRLLPAVRLDLEPCMAAGAFAVNALGVLGDDPFEALFLGGFEECDAFFLDVLAQVHVRQATNDFREQFRAAA